MPRRRNQSNIKLYLDEKVIICGVVKNNQNKMKFNIEESLKTGKYFKDFKLVIYENNSTDNTKNILNSYKNNNKIVILSEDLKNIKENSKFWSYKEVTGSDHSCRIEQISNARNKILEEINKKDYDDYKYVIMIDLDSKGWVFKNFDFFKEDYWDVLYAVSNPYYDWYALRSIGDLDPSFMGEEWWKNINNKINLNKPLKVWSAFNGMGIFKKEIFKNNKYDFQVNEDVKILFRKTINSTIYNKYKNLIETEYDKYKGRGIKDEKSDIIWKDNSGYKGKVVCEHVCLNASLINKNYKIFIHPNIIYKDGGR